MVNFKSIAPMTTRLGLASILAAALVLSSGLAPEPKAAEVNGSTRTTLHKTVKVDGLDIFYREAGPMHADRCIQCMDQGSRI